jgi:hypothetical protein
VRRLTIVAGAIALALSGCGIHGLNFVQDSRVRIVSPHDNADVKVPFTVRWTVDDFAGSFGVFVDRAPPSPGKTLASLADGDTVCKATRGCPDEAYLANDNRHEFPHHPAARAHPRSHTRGT